MEKKSGSGSLEKNSLEELRNMLSEAVGNEDYEKASKIRDEIKRREQE